MRQSNERNMRQWIVALRSGDYFQGQEKLRYLAPNPEDAELAAVARWCCMGVVCDVAVRDGLEMRVQSTSTGRTRYNSSAVLMPMAVFQWLGLNPEEHTRTRFQEDGWDVIITTGEIAILNIPGFVEASDSTTNISAVAANDNLGWTFDQIADALEATYLPADWAVTVAVREGGAS